MISIMPQVSDTCRYYVRSLATDLALGTASSNPAQGFEKVPDGFDSYTLPPALILMFFLALREILSLVFVFLSY